MSGGVHGGRFAAINGIPAVRNWQINDNGSLASFVNSATAIGHGRRVGITSWSGNYAAHGGNPAVYPGQEIGFTGYSAPYNDLLGAAGPTYVGNAMIASIGMNWDWASGNVLEHQVAFEGDLGLTTNPAGTAVLDATLDDPEPVGPCHIDFSADGTTWTALSNVAQATLQIVNAIQSYVNSSTSGGTGRKAGILDASGNLVIQDSLLGSAVLVKGTAYQFRWYTTASLFWLTKWMRVKEFTGLQPNPETGAIESYNCALEMAGIEDVAGTPTKGTILAPGATLVW